MTICLYITNAALLFKWICNRIYCVYDLYVGCTDSIACNYNPEAISDDGSCEYINKAHVMYV